MTAAEALARFADWRRGGFDESAPRLRRAVAMFALALVVAGCASELAQDVEIPLRNPTVPLGGTSRFDAVRFAGDWETVGCLGSCAKSVKYVVAENDIILRQADESETSYTLSAPGVLRQTSGGSTLVVMWVDEGFRTAAVGDADGRWAVILNRGRNAAADRIRAAREILDFNGWDVSRLREGAV